MPTKTQSRDFAADLPRGAVGTIQPVPGAKTPPPEISLVESNKRAMAAFWKARESDPFLPKPEVINGVEVYRSAPTPQQLELPSAEEINGALTAARDGLRRALEVRVEMQRKLDDASEALGRGQHAVDAVRDALAGTGDPDSLIATYKVGCAKAGKSGRPLPESLERKRAERDHAARELTDAQNAVAVLEHEHASAQQAFTNADSRVSEAVARCMDHHAMRLAIEMLDHQRRAFALRQQLVALKSLGVRGKPYTLPTPVSVALGRDPVPWQSTPATVREAILQNWQKRVAALLLNPDASLGNDGDG